MDRMYDGSYPSQGNLLSSSLNQFIHIYTAEPMLGGWGVEMGVCIAFVLLSYTKDGFDKLHYLNHEIIRGIDPRLQLKNVCTMESKSGEKLCNVYRKGF